MVNSAFRFQRSGVSFQQPEGVKQVLSISEK